MRYIYKEFLPLWNNLFISLIFLIILINIHYTECNILKPTYALNEDDFKNAEKLTKDELEPSPTTIEVINNYKPDIRGPVASSRRRRRNGVSRLTKLWPSAIIPYAISPHYTSHERALLARAVKQYHEKTCIRFIPRNPGQTDYLFIGKVDGCFSEVGRTSGVQVLSLDNGCMEYPTIIHEMMHVVGFYHEHERWDRDSYIDIIWQNIDRGALDQFGKVDLTKTSYYGQDYDYKSILHYDSLAFSKNGLPTMLPKVTSMATTIGNAKDFSEVDLKKINRMYKCKDYIDMEVKKHPTSGEIFTHAKALSVPIYNSPYNNIPIQPTFTYTKNPYQPKNQEFNNNNNKQTNEINLINSSNSYVPHANNPFKPHFESLIQSTAYDPFTELGESYSSITSKDSENYCVDRITVCWWTKSRCHMGNVKTMMRTLCAKTCGFC
uniref:Metalloendopeptidase n=1 Tax=Strongyloides stercoralis TaxID=6248 RepID=A0A0K0ECQ1_STRER